MFIAYCIHHYTYFVIRFFFIRFEFDLKCKVEGSSNRRKKTENKQFTKEYSMLPYWPESQGPLTFRYNRFCKKKLS